MSQPQISSTDRIRDLSTINDDVPKLLSSAGAALKALTGTPIASTDSTHTNGDIDLSPSAIDGASQPSLVGSKEAFTHNTQAYFTTLQAITARLRRQAYALEEAGIISAETPSLAAASSSSAQQQPPPRPGQMRGAPAGPGQGGQREEPERLTNGGLGNLDVAFLNSRVGAGGLEKEGEVLGEIKRLAEEAIAAKEGEDAEMGDAPA